MNRAALGEVKTAARRQAVSSLRMVSQAARRGALGLAAILIVAMIMAGLPLLSSAKDGSFVLAPGRILDAALGLSAWGRGVSCAQHGEAGEGGGMDRFRELALAMPDFLLIFAIQSAVVWIVSMGGPKISFGSTAGRLAILPFLAIDFIEALPVQALSVAAMMGKLGIAKITIGGTSWSLDPDIYMPVRSEWLGLLGCRYDTMFTKPRLFLAPFAGWLLVLACTLFLASGLRKGFARGRKIASLS